MNYIERTLNALKHIKENGPTDREFGICANLAMAADRLGYSKEHQNQMFELFRRTYELWPKYSGEGSYPVPSGKHFVSAFDAFYIYSDMWEGTYGALRKELLDFCINWLSNEEETTSHCVAPVYSD